MIGDGRPLAILIAEADQLVRMVTADMLTDLGYRAIEVGTAAEALALLQGPDTVRMLITGRSIVGDGVALVHLVHHRWPGVGIIVTSGAGADLRSALPPGTRLLSKPYKFADLIQEVEAGLGQVRDEPATAPVLPSGVPPHRGLEMGNGVGALAAPSTEPDKS
ncbi:response regulator [Methylobacterium sp. J-092]|uniref:response regulator n=1 Tax=Methylobacterium sp. J-092 TaxID=2836667 RepID=UPI001FBB4DEC|nr:response regulator [Methylobacterium sp. J-092]MCJ2010684.1 response regulator [Methylobacterium sp. J-092]